MSARLFLAGLLLLAAVTAAAQQDATRTEPSVSDFSVIWQRNVFDPERTPWRPRPRIEYASREEGPVVRVERFSLSGVMVQLGHTYAFFEGSDSEFNRVAKPGDRLGGVLLAAVRTDGATLEVDGERIDLPVGMQLSRRGEGPWSMGERERPAEPERDFRGGGGDPGEAYRRMIERRNRETGGEHAASAPEHRGDRRHDEASGGGGDEDAAQRMIERRRRETGG